MLRAKILSLFPFEFTYQLSVVVKVNASILILCTCFSRKSVGDGESSCCLVSVIFAGLVTAKVLAGK